MRKLVCIILAMSLFAPLACNRDQQQASPPPQTAPTTNAADLQKQFAQALADEAKKKQEESYLLAQVRSKQFVKAPAMTIDPKHAYTATISTERGDIIIQLDPQNAPITVNSFVFLARHNYFDGLKFHRVQEELIQGGDPMGNGSGGPGYTIPDETLHNKTLFGVGAVAMANRGPDTNGSQFFVCLIPTGWWDQWQGKYTIFGQVTSGLDAAKAIIANDVMKKVTIVESATTQPTTNQ